MKKVWLITGASKGFGLEIARAALAAGDKVVATVRKDPEQLAGNFPASENLLVVVLDVTKEEQIIPRPQYCMPLDQSWNALPNLTMLGDAAHLMPPYAGEGVNMAMLDALELSVSLTNEAFPDTRSAIAAYEEQMSKRFAEVGKMTMEQTASLHAPNALSNMMAMFG